METLNECEVERLAIRLVARHGSKAEAAVEQHIARARRIGAWDHVTFWCRVRWRARLVQRRIERGAAPAAPAPRLALTCP